MFFISLIGAVISIILGLYILFAGRLALWATLGIISLATTANLLAVLVAGLDSGRELVLTEQWGLLGIAAGAAVLGGLIGHYKQDLAVLLIGFIAGANATVWFSEISNYLVTSIVRQSEQTLLGVNLVVLFVGGLLGLALVRQVRDEALILITMIIGAQILQDALRLSKTSSWTAIFVIMLALAGILVQYAVYLREQKSGQTALRPQASSIAYFQDLELDL